MLLFSVIGCKDNFHIRIHTGNILSSEGKKVFAGEKQNQIREEVKQKGAGFMIIDGEDVERIQVLKADNEDILYEKIEDALNTNYMKASGEAWEPSYFTWYIIYNVS